MNDPHSSKLYTELGPHTTNPKVVFHLVLRCAFLATSQDFYALLPRRGRHNIITSQLDSRAQNAIHLPRGLWLICPSRFLQVLPKSASSNISSKFAQRRRHEMSISDFLMDSLEKGPTKHTIHKLVLIDGRGVWEVKLGFPKNKLLGRSELLKQSVFPTVRLTSSTDIRTPHRK